MVWNILLLLLFSIALPVHGGAQAPSFKDKSVHGIVGFPAGGGADAEGRVIARHFGKYQ
jgi:tripartite-type tricarboxylate transporter receptor subunit TctC